MVGGGEGAFIGARAPHRRPPRRPLRARRRRPLGRRREGAALGPRARPRPPIASTATTRAMAKAEARASRRHRGGVDRHAEPPPRAGGERVPRSRHPRHLRQAGHHDAARKRRSCRSWRRRHERIFAVTHNYTGYPMVRQARADGARGRARRDPRRAGRVPAGLVDRGARSRPARSRPTGAPTRRAAAPAARSATSARTRTTWPPISPASSSTSCAPS